MSHNSDARQIASDLGLKYVQMYDLLVSPQMDQAHLFVGWKQGTTTPAEVKQFFDDLIAADAKYPGGLSQYVENARRLLGQSLRKDSSLAGYTPEVPVGESVTSLSERFFELEQIGMADICSAAFVLVAGGLGERLGYHGIKIGLPVDSITKKTYLQWYCEFLKGYGRANNQPPPPLAIMTSDDTHDRTVELLQKNQNFGMPANAIKLVRQGKVPALVDSDAHFGLEPCPEGGNPATHKLRLDCKPHGHGDVHSLLFMEGVLKEWRDQGRKWVIFFQDTNALVFRAIPAALGVSISRGFHMNSVTVPRRAKEAAGGIVQLKKKDGSSITCNVEYNELGPMLLAATGKDDLPDASGYSPYPANLNVFILGLPTYYANIERTRGQIDEFVNPKYLADNKTFTKPTRLECMMQEYPKQVRPEDIVGFTQFERWMAFSAVKNKVTEAAEKAKANMPPECAATGEFDMYHCNWRILQQAGATIAGPLPQQLVFEGVPVMDTPKVHLSPEYFPTCKSIVDRVRSLRMTTASVLIVDAPGARLDGVEINGALVVRTADKTVTKETYTNRGYQLVPLAQLTGTVAEQIQIRGYDFVPTESTTL